MTTGTTLDDQRAVHGDPGPSNRLDLVNLTKVYTTGQRTVRAVDNLSLHLKPGETLGIVGESGSGKTTTGRLIARLLEPTSGEILMDGRRVSNVGEDVLRPLRAEIGMIFQDAYASLNPRQRIADIIMLPLKVHSERGRDRRREVEQLLHRVGLSPAENFAGKFPHQLSGGQRQRVAVARAIALKPKLLIADEPVSALDVSVAAQILNLIVDLRDELGPSCIFISHDLGVVHAVTDRVAVMYRGRIVEEGVTSDVLRNPNHPYTQALVASIPENLIDRFEDVAFFARSPASAITAPETASCNFAGRCPYTFDRCLKEVPNLLQVSSSHAARCFLVDEPGRAPEWRARTTDDRAISTTALFER